MAINRTPFNALIDDDGSGTTGSVWNKSAIAGVVLDPVDAAINPINAPSTAFHVLGGPLQIGGGLVVNSAPATIQPNTLDGADTTYVALCGGGIIGQTRGAYIVVGGNEAAGNAGQVKIVTGAVAGATVELYRPNGAVAVQMIGATGALLVNYGLQFPVAAAPSSDSYTLDDYREVSWIPVFAGTGGNSGQVYSSQVGRAIKKGREVSAYCWCALSTKGTISGDVYVNGLPFPSEGSTAIMGSCAVWFSGLATNWVNIIGLITSGNLSALALRGSGAAASSTNNVPLTGTDLTNSSIVALTITYHTAS